ncbi:lipoate--protein ligase family protein [Candidatus Methylacidiphilum infernorum]|uniref:Lipoate--protein ligase family protein n=2 Tax=Candidatus Methylacidiphilum infernorum TaxID=511746 RepID=A0ABX7PWC4_9BACT|nr:lipoate--protein ligase family protein [Candidatus Methylacidiphilum infernorum]
MMQTWSLVLEGPFNGELNMALDEAYLGWVSHPLLRIYRFSEPMISIGYFQKWKEIPQGSKFVRRYTGGGAVYHGEDCTYTLVFPKNHSLVHQPARESYYIIHKALERGIGRLGLKTEFYEDEKKQEGSFCFLKPVKYDLMWENRKIAGAAQRRNRHGLLHQGSIAIPRGVCFKEMVGAVIEGFLETFQVDFLEENISPEVWGRAVELEEKKYKSFEWNYMR